MTRIELIAFDVVARGWLLFMVFSVTVIVTGLLRKPCQRVFGTERAIQLWLLPPLAMLASQLPHAEETSAASMSTFTTLVTKIGHIPAPSNPANAANWCVVVATLWLAGMVITLGAAMHAQSRYRSRMRGATRVDNAPSRLPVLRAEYTDVGPALVGAWRPRIVLPADFDDRYEIHKRALILAHEAMHARRRDGLWSLFAQIVVALFWFHPFAWLALSALRLDQEFACDAAVLREQGEHKRSYANAMLKTQAAVAPLPVGCPWSPRHPMTERIAMLRFSCPSKPRRLSGAVFVGAILICAASSVYAASKPDNAVLLNPAAIYQLAVRVSSNGEILAAPIVCVKAGEPASIEARSADGRLAWHFDLVARPLSAARVEIGISDSMNVVNKRGVSSHPVMRGPFDQAMVMRSEGAKEGAPIELTITPSRECPASKVAMRRSQVFSAR